MNKKEVFILDILIGYAQSYGPRLIGAIVILLVGLILIKCIIKVLSGIFEKRNLDPTATRFILSICRVVLYVILVIICLSMLQIDMTPLVAMLSIFGLAATLAVQDTLTNFASGCMLLFAKPFQAGNYIEIGDMGGVVQQISIIRTKLLTPDHRVIYIPNGQVASAKIVNYSEKGSRLVELSLTVAKEHLEEVEVMLNTFFTTDPLVMEAPSPFLRIVSLSDTNVDLASSFWVKSEDYRSAYDGLLTAIKLILDEKQVAFSYKITVKGNPNA